MDTRDTGLTLEMKLDLLGATTSGSFHMEIEAFLARQQDQLQTPWVAMRDHLLAASVSTDHQEYQRGLLAKVQQQSGETLLTFHRRFREAANEAYPGNRSVDQNWDLVGLYGETLLKASDARKLVSVKLVTGHQPWKQPLPG